MVPDELPEIIGIVLGFVSLIGGVIGLPSIIAWALNRKGANRRLTVEERTLETNQFTAITNAQRDLRDQLNADNERLRAELTTLAERLDKQERESRNRDRDFRAQRRELDRARLLLADADDRLRRVYDLLIAVTTRAGIELTEIERHILDESLPPDHDKHPPTT